MTPLISLVIPVYNRAHYLPATLDSILCQTYPHFELLIWDDGSTDDSVDIATYYAQQDKRLRLVAAPHQGQTRSLQQAIAQTTAPYLGWVDSDDLLAPTALEESVTLHHHHRFNRSRRGRCPRFDCPTAGEHRRP